jgi:ABC-2 type transport system permease protein
VSGGTYMRYELLRTLRNRRFFVFSLGFPLVLFYVIAGPNRHDRNFGGSGIPAAVYYMVGLAAFGTMNTMLATGARIATERAAGWNRQLRLTPLTTRVYFRTKVATGYLMALVTLGLLYAAGISIGVSLSAGTWLRMTALVLVGLVPFAALGILLGHMLTPDTIGPVMGGSTALFALLGGTWFPVEHGAMHFVAGALPSYWLVQASHVAVGGQGWGTTGWLVVGAWTVAPALLAGRAYRNDTRRA